MSNIIKEPASKKMFAVWSNTDLTEGRGQEYVRAFCHCETTARRIAKGAYVMGSNAPISQETVYLINNRWYYSNVYIETPTNEDIAENEKLIKEKQKEALKIEKT